MDLYDTAIRHKNPDTNQELIIPIKLVGPVSYDKYKANFLSNIERHVPWLDESPINDIPAIICGAAPSLLNHLDKIKELQGNGGKVFGCNSACKTLYDHGVEVDYQPVLDAHECMKNYMHLDAKSHILASYVDTSLFEMSKNAILFHPSIDWIEEHLKDDPRKFMYIGGGVSVTISALCIAYTMGYREIHVFGMDSCFEGDKWYANGEGIAKHETNQLEVTVDFNDKSYRTTYDMKQQVIVFVDIAKLLLDSGCKLGVHGEGLLQDVWKSKQIGA